MQRHIWSDGVICHIWVNGFHGGSILFSSSPGILQEEIFIVSNDICPLIDTSMDDIRAIPHGFKLPFSSLIMGLVVNEDEVPLAKGG